eukprot:2305166-Amphidinium_carterae.1
MVADARACEPADFFMAPHDRVTCLQGKGSEIDHILCNVRLMECCQACSIIGLDSFPTHCAVVIEVLLGPSCACDVIAVPWEVALARCDLDDVFRFWSTRWKQWLVDLAIAEEQQISRSQRGRGLSSTKLSQPMKRASWQCESLPEE